MSELPERIRHYIRPEALREPSTPEPPPSGRVSAAASSDCLTPAEVLTLETTAERAGRCGFAADHLGVTFKELRARLEETAGAASWQVFARYLRDLERQTAAGHGWMIQGPTGVGKTAALALIAEAETRRVGSIFEPASEAEARGHSPRRRHALLAPMVEIADLCMQRTRTDAWQQRMDALREVTHLLVDDLGAEYLEPYGANLFYQLIDGRTRKLLPTHFTLNMRVDNLAEARALGVNAPRLYSRLRRRNYVLTLTGADRRQPLDPARLLAEVEWDE